MLRRALGPDLEVGSIAGRLPAGRHEPERGASRPRPLALCADLAERRAAAVREAQRLGHVTEAFSASQILDLIESLAVGWSVTARAHLNDREAIERDRSNQRRAIEDAVRHIVSPSR
jgi:hypothetical protein